MPAEPRQEIADDCGLLRRINPIHLILDRNTGQRRLSSGAFRAREMSVDAECLMPARGEDYRFSLRGYANFYLVRFFAGFARQQSQTVEHRPIENQAEPAKNNPFHTEVIGRKSDPICNAFRANAEWVVGP
jgi:hypothetical protein